MKKRTKRDLADLMNLDGEQLANAVGGLVSGETRLQQANTGGSEGKPGDTTDQKHEHTDDDSGWIA